MIRTAQASLRLATVWDPPLWMWESQSPSPGPGATGSSMSDYMENELLDHVLSAATFTAAATLHYGLFITPANDDASGTQVSGGSYARQAATNNATNFPAASGGAKANGAAVNFGTASANWGSVGYVALFDASSGGNMYFWGPMVPSIPILNGDSLNFPIGNITFSFD